jgi:hypothetical protein
MESCKFISFCAAQKLRLPLPIISEGRRGYHELRRTSLAACRSPAKVRRTVGLTVFLYVAAYIENALFCRAAGITQ